MMHLIPSVAVADSACSWPRPLGVSSYWPRVSSKSGGGASAFAKKVERARDSQRVGRRGFQPRMRPGGENVPGPLRGEGVAETVVNSLIGRVASKGPSALVWADLVASCGRRVSNVLERII